jgi:hypothetical protein
VWRRSFGRGWATGVSATYVKGGKYFPTGAALPTNLFCGLRLPQLATLAANRINVSGWRAPSSMQQCEPENVVQRLATYQVAASKLHRPPFWSGRLLELPSHSAIVLVDGRKTPGARPVGKFVPDGSCGKGHEFVGSCSSGSDPASPFVSARRLAFVWLSMQRSLCCTLWPEGEEIFPRRLRAGPLSGVASGGRWWWVGW